MTSPHFLRRKPAQVLLVAALFIGVAIIALYAVRKPIAQGWIDSALKKRGVLGTYELTQLDPNHQRLEHVIIGDPAHPDLTAEWIETETYVGLFGASVTGVKVHGAHIHGAVMSDGALRFGQLDKFSVGGSGPLKLPSLALTLADVNIVLDTPYGLVNAQLNGSGNPTRDFAGRIGLQTAAMTSGGCTIAPLTGQLDVRISSSLLNWTPRPHVTGPIRAQQTACAGTMLVAPNVQIDITLAPDFASGGGRIKLAASKITSPYLSQAAHGLDYANGTPLAPISDQLRAAVTGIGGGIALDGVINYAGGNITVQQITAASRSGAHATFSPSGGTLKVAGARTPLSGVLALAGGGFPASEVVLDGTADHLTGTGRFAQLAAPETRIALTPVRFVHDARGTRLSTTARFDGRVAGGLVRGLTVPINGILSNYGGFAMMTQCIAVHLDSLQLSSISLGSTATDICLNGQDISIKSPHLAGRAAGEAFDIMASGLRYGLKTKALVLDAISGHYGPARLSAARVAYHIGPNNFDANALHAAVGAAGHETTLAVDSIVGAMKGGGFRGRYVNASGSITNVPLKLGGSSGQWEFANANLALTGNLNVADTTPVPHERFEPLIVPDVALHYTQGIVTATGTLREPKSGAFVSRVVINHNIAKQVGGANIDILEMPLLTFNKALQPEALTLFTNGLIANVRGSISGQGRIRWSSNGVTSDGDFETKKIDLAALFGVVTGLSGKIHFTDLLGMVSSPHQELRVASVNPGILVNNGVVHYQLLPLNHLAIEDGMFPFADGKLSLEPTVMDLSQSATRRLTFTVKSVDAAKFITQSGFEDIAATGVFDGTLPLIFDATGGRIEGGALAVREAGGTVSYVGPVSNATLGRYGQLAFDALKSIRYHGLTIELNGPLDGEMVTLVKLSGTNESPKAAKKSYLMKQITGIPFKFNIRISAPFRNLFSTAKNLDDPSALVQQDLPANLRASAAPQQKPPVHPAANPIQPKESEPVR